MSLLKMKTDFIKRGAYDELYTPIEATQMIIEYIPTYVQTIWECTAIDESNITTTLNNNGYTVIPSHIKDGKDFFNYTPAAYDIIITNPPYSLKDKFLEHAFSLNKPFMFLLPLTALEGQKRNKLFNKHGIQLLIPNKRFNFKPNSKSGAWFQTSWFCHNCNLPNDLNFINLQ